ncbi:MAG: hypothetical protein ACT4O2_13745 [Beijerinckiaceae bacterium]
MTIFLIEKDDYDAMLRYDVIVKNLREGKLTLNAETLDGRVNGAES